MAYRHYLCILFSLLYIAFPLVASEAEDNFLNSETVSNANVGYLVKNLRTGEVYASFRANNVVAPASTMKLLTTSTALEMLGGDFRFETYLETDGKIENGILNGNVYIRGTGDPTLGSQKVGNQMFLYKWTQMLVRKGIKQINGDIVADMSFFDADAVNPAWMWEDIGNYYAPAIFSLAYLDNTVNIQLRSAEIGSVAEVVKTLPAVEELQFENHIRCTKIEYDGAYVHGMPLNNTRYLVGSVPSNRGIFGVKGDLPNPGLLLARHFKANLQEQGVTVSGAPAYITEQQLDADGNPVERTMLYIHLSEPLRDIIAETNINSNNHYAEQVFRYLGSRITVPTTISNSQLIINSFWKNRKINLSACRIEDGSGLAPIDAVSPEVFVALLAYMYKSKNFADFYASLPVAGESGTLRSFCYKTALEHRLHAKSGTTSTVKSYAGYIEAENGDTWAFSVVVNNQKGKVMNAQKEIQRFLNDIYKAHK